QGSAAKISYGHSDGRVETKEQFINGVMTRKQTVKSLAFPDLKVSVVGEAAIARHIYLAESELDGKQTTTKIGALQVWQKQNGGGKWLARQGFRLRPTSSGTRASPRRRGARPARDPPPAGFRRLGGR